MKKSIILLVACIVFFFERSHAQDSSRHHKVLSLRCKSFTRLHQKPAAILQKLENHNSRYLFQLQKQEEKIKRKLLKSNPALADSLFANLKDIYEELKNHQGQLGMKDAVYSGHLDSLRTALVFLKSLNPNPDLLLKDYDQLHLEFNHAGWIGGTLEQRQEELVQALNRLGLVRQLKRYQKQVYYYEQQIRSVIKLFEEPAKFEKKLLELAVGMDGFKEFFSKQSLLASFFAVPVSTKQLISMNGLQTRAMVNRVMIDRLGIDISSVHFLKHGMQSAQQQLNVQKDRLMNGIENSNEEKPLFQPNHQRTKSFWQRLEWGTSLQTEKARYQFPLTTDIGLSMGYRLNDRSVMGIGVSYKMGLGKGWDHLAFSHQGIGLRTYLDWKLSPGSTGIMITGGYEVNYRSLIHSVEELKHFNAWQSSGLLGLSKRYRISSPAGHKKQFLGDVKILWDYLSFKQRPRSQPFMIRMGYYLY